MQQSVRPKAPLLRKYIYNYNVLLHDGPQPLSYYVFPVEGVSMALCLGTKISSNGNEVHLVADQEAAAVVNMLGKYSVPLLMTYSGKVRVFSVNFFPNGVNYFFDTPYGKMAPKPAQNLNPSSFEKVIEKLYDEDENVENKIDMLDEFFLSRFMVKKHDYLNQAIALLQSNGEITIQEVAVKCNVTIRTLRRNFKAYLGCSPTAFKKIIRFRRAIRAHFFMDKTQMTDLAHASTYYDSSHFIREFKALTGQKPSAFFGSVTQVSQFKFPYKVIQRSD